MSVFERYLTVWVAACIVAGVTLGKLFPAVFEAIGAAEVARVNLPVALLVWLMIIPMLVKIDFRALRQVGTQPVARQEALDPPAVAPEIDRRHRLSSSPQAPHGASVEMICAGTRLAIVSAG